MSLFQGVTKVYAKNGRLTKEFSSALPGGHREGENRKASKKFGLAFVAIHSTIPFF